MKNPIVFVAQMQVGDDKIKNLNKALSFIERAKEKNADFIILPEMFICPYENSQFVKNAEPIDGMIINRLTEKAKEHQVYIIAGTIPEMEETRIYNTAVVIDRNGKIIAKHRKVHLFDLQIKGEITFSESETLTPGDEITIFNTEFGAFGVAICYDIRFPELFRMMALNGAEAVFVPASFNMTTGPVHWDLLARSRALDNQFYVIMASSARDLKSDYVSYGHSLISDPWGHIIKKLDEKEGFILNELDLDYTKQVKEKIQIYEHRRKDLYKLLRE